MKQLCIFVVVVLSGLGIPLVGQEVEPREVGRIANDRLFGIEFPGGLAFYGAANRVVSASLQEYHSGPYIVTEVVIDLAGGVSQLRIYVTELIEQGDVVDRIQRGLPPGVRAPPRGVPSQAEQLTRRALRPLEEATDDVVVKHYPHTTHARTVEYRLSRRGTLVDFYDDFVRLWDGSGLDAEVEGEEQQLDSLGGVRFYLAD